MTIKILSNWKTMSFYCHLSSECLQLCHNPKRAINKWNHFRYQHLKCMTQEEWELVEPNRSYLYVAIENVTRLTSVLFPVHKMVCESDFSIKCSKYYNSTKADAFINSKNWIKHHVQWKNKLREKAFWKAVKISE